MRVSNLVSVVRGRQGREWVKRRTRGHSRENRRRGTHGCERSRFADPRANGAGERAGSVLFREDSGSAATASVGLEVTARCEVGRVDFEADGAGRRVKVERRGGGRRLGCLSGRILDCAALERLPARIPRLCV